MKQCHCSMKALVWMPMRRKRTCQLAVFSGKLPSMEAEIGDKWPSNSRYLLWASTYVIAASIVLLASCSIFQPVIDVVPVASLQHGVVFYLDEVISGHPAEFTITALTVREKQSDGSTRDVWSVEGAQSLRYITYGAKYPGLEEYQRPLRLKRGNRYEVFVYTRAKGFDLFAFRVDENGNVRQAPWFQF